MSRGGASLVSRLALASALILALGASGARALERPDDPDPVAVPRLISVEGPAAAPGAAPTPPSGASLMAAVNEYVAARIDDADDLDDETDTPPTTPRPLRHRPSRSPRNSRRAASASPTPTRFARSHARSRRRTRTPTTGPHTPPPTPPRPPTSPTPSSPRPRSTPAPPVASPRLSTTPRRSNASVSLYFDHRTCN